MDESFPAKRFKSNKMIKCAMSRYEPTMHISEESVEFKILDRSTVDHLFHGFYKCNLSTQYDDDW